MVDFSEVIEELAGSGFTEEEAVYAAAALAKIPRIDDILKNPMAFDFTLQTFDHGFNPSSPHQKVMSDAIETFSDREWECYSRHHIGGESMGNIAKDIGVSKGAVQRYIMRAREKMETAVKAAG